MEPLQRRDQTEGLREWFNDETVGQTTKQKLEWLFKLYDEHIVGRLIPIAQTISRTRPLDEPFFQSDLIKNLFIINGFVQKEIQAVDNSDELAAEWQRFLDQIEICKTSKEMQRIEELETVFRSVSVNLLDRVV